MTMEDYARQIAQRAKEAAPVVGNAGTLQKNNALSAFARLLGEKRDKILSANERDLSEAGELSDSLRERLSFREPQLKSTIAGIDSIIAQDDPVGEIESWRALPSGIRVGKMRVPIGVILMIYESRPNVTADAAALAIKAGNAIILRGGSEARHTNAALGECLTEALLAHGLADAARVIDNYDREIVGKLLTFGEDIDMVVPRGGRGLVERVSREAQMPVLKHLEGNCHVYIDESADPAMAVQIVDNSKTRRYGVCNAAESVLVHRAIASAVLPGLHTVLRAKEVEIRCCPESPSFLPAGAEGVVAATEEDWGQEYLAPVISLKIVDDLAAAIAHINRHGSRHTDAIVTQNLRHAWQFLRAVDSSSVIVNASTGFADGGEFGLGAEIGISTDKLHARGPVGLAGLTSQKYVVMGDGECR